MAPVTPARWFSLAALLTAAALSAQPLDTLARNYHDKPSPAARQAVLTYANAHAKDTSGALALLVLVVGEMDSRQYKDALAHLATAGKRLPSLADYPAYLKAAADYETQSIDKVQKDLKPVWDNSPTSPLVVKAVVLEANAYIDTGEPRKAVQLLEQRGAEIAPEKTALLLATAYEEKVEHLNPNIGYLKFNAFLDPAMCGATATAAMNFLANVDATIFDLRENGGGDPKMVAYLSSYFFDDPAHLNDLYNRTEDSTTQSWTLPSVPAKRLTGKPAFILTSKRTFSARKSSPTTNWEGKGVEPDVKVPAAEALDVAKKMAAEQIRNDRDKKK